NVILALCRRGSPGSRRRLRKGCVARCASGWRTPRITGHIMTDDYAAPVDIFQLKSKGLQHHGLRQNNLRVVLNVIGFNAGLSNAEIARMSGLAPQTVSAILN